MPRTKQKRREWWPNELRHTETLQVRCSPDLAQKARLLARNRGLKLADLIDAGVDAIENELVSVSINANGKDEIND